MRPAVSHHTVMPAKAGIHATRDAAQGSWMPACAGMTK